MAATRLFPTGLQDAIEYFKWLAEQNGIPYQNLINLYLRECAEAGKTLTMKWD
jgi:hypothetical protein